MVNSNIEWEWIIVGCYLYTSVEREDRQMDRKSIKLYLLLNRWGIKVKSMLKSERHAGWILCIVYICKNIIFLLSQYYSKTDTKNPAFFPHWKMIHKWT